jgi:lipopolysaccharide assembly protein A
MQFLKTLFWVVLAIVAVIFAMNNWQPARIMLWGGLILEIKLPILVFGAFAIGFLPTFGWHRASRWRMQRRIESHERALADMRGIDPVVHSAPAPAFLTPAPGSTIEPPAQS